MLNKAEAEINRANKRREVEGRVELAIEKRGLTKTILPFVLLMTIPEISGDFGIVIATSELLQNGVTNVSVNFCYEHNYICQTELKLNSPILGHSTADYVNNIYVYILGVVYLEVENQEECFHVIDSFYSDTWSIAPAILWRMSYVSLHTSTS